MNKIDHTKLKATPEQEDFHHKYTEEGAGLIGSKLLDGYFDAVQQLIKTADLKAFQFPDRNPPWGGLEHFR